MAWLPTNPRSAPIGLIGAMAYMSIVLPTYQCLAGFCGRDCSSVHQRHARPRVSSTSGTATHRAIGRRSARIFTSWVLLPAWPRSRAPPANVDSSAVLDAASATAAKNPTNSSHCSTPGVSWPTFRP